MPLILSVKNLKMYFGMREGVVKAVDGVSFDLEKGWSLGIVGESGCGKSVTVLSVMGLIPTPPGIFSAERVIFDDKDMIALSADDVRDLRGRDMAMIFQDPMTSLNPFLKISRQLTEVLEIHKGMSYKEALKASIEMLDVVGIPDATKRVHDYPHQFSGGMRQRVMIAMSLLCKPKLIIADEPTTALDVTIQAQILELLKDLKREFGMSIIIITHDLGVVAGMCDYIAVMYAGKIVEYGTGDEIFATPKHPYTVSLLKSIPRLDEERKDRLATIKDQPPDMAKLPTGCVFHPRCYMATERCKEAYPAQVNVGGGRYTCCWHWEKVTRD